MSSDDPHQQLELFSEPFRLGGSHHLMIGDLQIILFAPKLEDILEYFILKNMKDFNFPFKNQNFDLKLNIQNFEKKRFENSEFVDFWGHFKLKMFC
mgnify:CR=1 FL=1